MLPYRHVEDDELEDPTFGEDSQIKRRAKLQVLTLKHFRSRWQHEYLTSLREFHKTSGNNRQKIKVREIVLVHDDTPRMNWKLAVIEGLINNELTQAANIRTATGKTNRPISRLYPMEVSSTTEQSTEDKSNFMKNRESNASTTTTCGHQDREGLLQRDVARKARKQMMEWSKILCTPQKMLWISSM